MPTLLVVDDESAIQHAFRRAYRDNSIELVFASTCAQALERVSQQKPDAVVLDVNLPDATGLQVFHQIRALDARIPVILITGHGTTELAIEAIKEGAYEYLLKPLELAQLREVIDRALRRAELMRVPGRHSRKSRRRPTAIC